MANRLWRTSATLSAYLLLAVRLDLSIVGNPKLFDEPHFLAHIINDGAMCKRPEASAVYEIASLSKANSLFDPVCMAQFATRDIKVGDEILNTYGAEYWLDLVKYA